MEASVEAAEAARVETAGVEPPIHVTRQEVPLAESPASHTYVESSQIDTLGGEASAPSVVETPAFDVAGFIASLPTEQQDLHRRANRVAKVTMQDIKLLKPGDVQNGRGTKRHSVEVSVCAVNSTKPVGSMIAAFAPFWITRWTTSTIGWWRSSRTAAATRLANIPIPHPFCGGNFIMSEIADPAPLAKPEARGCFAPFSAA